MRNDIENLIVKIIMEFALEISHFGIVIIFGSTVNLVGRGIIHHEKKELHF